MKKQQNYPCKLDALQARRAFLDLRSRQGHGSISEDVGQAYLDFGKLLHDSALLRVVVLNRVIAASGQLLVQHFCAPHTDRRARKDIAPTSAQMQQ